jgi:hypothetical protein
LAFPGRSPGAYSNGDPLLGWDRSAVRRVKEGGYQRDTTLRFCLTFGLILGLLGPAHAAPTRKPAVRKPAARKAPAATLKNASASPAAAALIKRRCAGLSSRINAHDLPGVRTYFSPELRVRTTRGRTQNYFQVLASMSRTFKRFPKYRTRLDVQKVVMRGNKAYMTAAYNNTGMKKPDRGRCNMIWKNSGGRWMLVSLSGA